MIIAVDFDGTIVEHKYPAIGKEIPFCHRNIEKIAARTSFPYIMERS